MFSEDTGRIILDEIKQKSLKHYNIDQMNKIGAEIKEVATRMSSLKSRAEVSGVTEELSVNFAVLKAYMERLQRITRAYHYYRFKHIEASLFKKEKIKNFLTTTEIDYEGEFSAMANECLEDYQGLALSYRSPPLDFYVQILTLEECGIVLCDEDFLDLKKGRIYFLKKSDVSHLVDRGAAKII